MKKRYKNTYRDVTPNIGKLLSWQFGFLPKDRENYSLEECEAAEPKVVLPSAAILEPNPEKLQVTWIGHSTFLIQYKGVNVLTDPIFSERASPFAFVGPRRLKAPGLKIKDIPTIDAVLISHNHYDHLDKHSIQALSKDTTFLVPAKLGSLLEKWKRKNVFEFEWWQDKTFPFGKATAVPAQHWSSRTLFDARTTLWSGWLITIFDKTIYFAGDTGYTPEFKELKNRAGSIHLSLIPIGSYSPRSFMEIQHINPEEAVQIHNEIGSRYSIGMHWGTFRLSDERIGEPPLRLRDALKKSGSGYPFVTLDVGETRTVSD
jgi:N-acyl-phosphatidylethanolamine-hydrolysing phospholipase D